MPNTDRETQFKSDLNDPYFAARIGNVHNAAKRVVLAWEYLLRNHNSLQIDLNRDRNGGREILFRNLLRVVFARCDSGAETATLHDGDCWSIIKGSAWSEEEWEDWGNLYRPQVRWAHEADTWDIHQVTNVMGAVVNYWNSAAYSESDGQSNTDGHRVFAEWLNPSSNLGETHSRQERWRDLWNIYRELTQRGAEDGLYTVNHYLHRIAPIKASLSWCYSEEYSTDACEQQHHDNPSMWVQFPPYLTPTIANTLGCRDVDTTLAQKDVSTVLRQYQTCPVSGCAIRSAVDKRLASLVRSSDAGLRSLGRYFSDLQSLFNVLTRIGDEADCQERSASMQSNALEAASYLVDLAIYLNIRLKTDSQGISTMETQNSWLGTKQCWFMARTLFEYYGPYALSTTSVPNTWYFYSIPVYLPLSHYGSGHEASWCSVFSLITKAPLVTQKIALWRSIGERIVFPAMTMDLISDRAERARATAEFRQAADLYARVKNPLDRLLRLPRKLPRLPLRKYSGT